MIHDYALIGGGIVGLAAARALLQRHPGASLVLLEKEGDLAQHQTGHNSGVIHAGLYYAPGSLKARLCRAGAEATKAFCAAHAIPFEQCGKLVVATSPAELARMNDLERRAGENGIAVERLDQAGLRAAEPMVAGLGALKVAATGIVSYRRICTALAAEITALGGEIRLDRQVRVIQEDSALVTVESDHETIKARRLIACAGLQSDRLARLAGLTIDHRIVPFRGEYYALPPERAGLVRHLIYPVPDPALPFLGVHLTRMIDGGITLGPNAVLGFAREGYPKGSVTWADIAEMAGFPGFWRVIAQHWRSGISEFGNSLIKQRYLDLCRRYCPDLRLDDLRPYPAGIRAQAVLRDGTLVHDFLFVESARMLHVCNAPSPAATSALPIGAMIADRLRPLD